MQPADSIPVAGTPDNFLGLAEDDCDYHHSRFAVLPVPYDGTASYLPGTRLGPRAIISASQQVELYDTELGGEFVSAGIATLDALLFAAAGPQDMHEAVYAAARPVFQAGKILLGLGGEHSITSGLARAARERYPDLSLLQIDAHADLRDSYQGSMHSHACVMRRIHELGIPAIGVGIRSYSAEEAEFMSRAGLDPVEAPECRNGHEWQDRVLQRLSPQVYVTIDIDGFDPAFAPGTGTPEPGGLDWETVTRLLRLVSQHNRIVAADIVEVLPLPGQAVTEFLAARLAYKLIAYIQAAEDAS